MTATWTDERVDTLRGLRTQGMTSPQIAKHMGLSRGMVMSKLLRIGMKGVGGRKIAVANVTAAAAQARARSGLPQRPKPMRVAEPRPTGLGLPLADLEVCQCRFIVGVGADDGLTRFCAAPAEKSYCPTHHAIVYKPLDRIRAPAPRLHFKVR